MSEDRKPYYPLGLRQKQPDSPESPDATDGLATPSSVGELAIRRPQRRRTAFAHGIPSWEQPAGGWHGRAHAVLNWAARSRDGQGHPLLESNPLSGLNTPSEKNPTRVLLTEPEYEGVLQVSSAMDWRFRVALVIAHETGHRIGAIRQLRWSDIDLEVGVIRWRGEHKKTGYEHRTPVSAEALAVLEEARRQNPGIGNAPGLPAPNDRSKCVSRSLARDWWEKAQELAGLEPKRGRGWHSLRRKFASDPMNQPLKEIFET